MGKFNEQKIIKLAKSGNEYAFSQLYETHHLFVFNYISKQSLDRNIVEDICSVAFKKAFSKIESYDETKSKFSTWLIQIAINTLIDHQKRKKEENRIKPLNSGETKTKNQVDTSESIEDKMDREIINELIIKILKHLSLEDRKVVDLFYYKDMSYKEITQEMNLSIDVIKVRLYRAKLKLKDIINNKKLLIE